MEVSAFVRDSIVGGTLLCLALMLWSFFRAFREGTHALGNIVEGAIMSIADHHKRKIQEEARFYEHPWTSEEARAMLHETRLELAKRTGRTRLHEPASLPDTSNLALALAVIAKLVPSTPELERQIAFLERTIQAHEQTAPVSEVLR